MQVGLNYFQVASKLAQVGPNLVPSWPKLAATSANQPRRWHENEQINYQANKTKNPYESEGAGGRGVAF